MALTKAEIKDKIRSRDPRVELKKSPNTKTAIWQNYLLVYVDDIKMTWACCVKCNELVTYSANTGTGGLHRHRCNKLEKNETALRVKEEKCIENAQVQLPHMEESNKEEEIMPMNFLENIYEEDNLCVEGYAPLSPSMEIKSKLKLNALTKKELKEKINAGDPSVELKKPNNTKTVVWQNFRVIYMGNKRLNWVYCIGCKEIIGYSTRTGTGGLHRHRCATQVKVKSNTEKNSLSSTVKNESITADVVNELSQKQLLFLTKDLLPYSVVEGKGFQELAQALINIGAQYGRQDVKNLLKTRRTISRFTIPAEYEKTKASIKTQLSDQHLAFTTDIWTDPYTQRKFLTLTAHHITKEFTLVVNLLANREFPHDQNVASSILNLIIEILNDFNLEHSLYNGVLITDNDSSIKAAFKNYKRLSCACQNLNLIMNDVLEKGNINELNVLIEASKDLVAYFEYSELNSRLTESLEQHIKSGWHSIFTMLNSIVKVYSEIQTLLMERNATKKLANIDYNFLNTLVNFLHPFKECSERLSIDSEPVIQEYVLWHQKLLNLCIIDTLDSDVIRFVKTATKTSLTYRFEPNNIHYVALFLNPPFKDLNCLPSDKREQVVASVKAMLTQINDNIKPIQADKKSKSSCSDNYSSDRFAEFYDTSFSAINYDNEVNKQMAIYMEKEIHFKEPILSFWEKNEKLYLLQELARQILCVPPSSTTIEKVFSIPNRILEQRRTHLLRENLNEILFLNRNVK